MSRLFICDTPFQVMAALLLSWTQRDYSDNDFIVTDNMPGAAEIAKRLSNLNSVRDACIAHVNHKKAIDLEKKLEYLLDFIMPFGVRWHDVFYDRVYDSLYVRNYADPFAVSAYNHYRQTNSAISLRIYDEGYSTYSRRFWQPDQYLSPLHSFAERLARTFGRQFPADNIESVRLLDPDMLRFELPFPVERMIPEHFPLDEGMLDDLNLVFGFHGNSDAILNFINDESINGTKYLFFEESFAVDCGNEDDFKVLKEISEIVGMKNILVKLHPRSETDRFSSLGYRVVGSAGYPWEIVALNIPCDSDVVLISCSSGSLLNYRFLCDKRMRSILLFELFQRADNALDEDEQHFFRDFCAKYSGSISIPTSYPQLLEALGV